MNSDARRHPGAPYANSPVYCPAQQATGSTHDFEQNIDPQLRSSARRPHLVPASFPNDDPYVPPDLHQTSGRAGFRSLRPRPSSDQRQWNGSHGAVGANYRRDTGRQYDGRPQPFNKELYPGYDEHGNRRGLDHLHGSTALHNGEHYRSRTHEYTSPHPEHAILERPSQPSQQPSYHIPPIHVSGPIPYHTTYTQPMTQMPQALNPILLQQPHMGTIAPNGLPRLKTVHELLGLDPGVSISLDSLRDPPPGQKPDYTLPTLVKIAILSSPRQALSLQEIYESIERRFPWFANCDNPKSWKTSIRHSLSLIAVFQKKTRPITDPGKGHYWYVDFSKGEGNKRVRKRNRPPGKNKRNQPPSEPAEGEDDLDELTGSDLEDNIDPALQTRSSGVGPIRNYRASSHAASNNAKGGPRPVRRKTPYPSPTEPQTNMRRRSMEREDERTNSEYSTPSHRELSLPPLQSIGYNHAFSNNGHLSVSGYKDSGSAEYPRASGFAVPAGPPATTTFIHHGAMDQVNFGSAIFSATPSRRDDTNDEVTNISRRFQMSNRNVTSYNPATSPLSNGIANRHSAQSQSQTNGFLTHSNGALPFGAGANPDTDTPHFGRPRDDIVLVNNGGLPSARRITREEAMEA